MADNVLLEVFTAFSVSVKASNLDCSTRAQNSKPSRKRWTPPVQLIYKHTQPHNPQSLSSFWLRANARNLIFGIKSQADDEGLTLETSSS